MTEQKINEIDINNIEIEPIDEITHINSRIKLIEKVIDNLKQSQDTTFTLIQNKGLDVGMPRRIRDDINELIGIINKLDNVWGNKENQEKRRNFDNDITKLINKGDITSAFLKISEELRIYKEDMIGVRMFLNLVTFKLNHLENELTKHEKK